MWSSVQSSVFGLSQDSDFFALDYGNNGFRRKKVRKPAVSVLETSPYSLTSP